MHKDFVFWAIETTISEQGQDELSGFSALRIHDGLCKDTLFKAGLEQDGCEADVLNFFEDAVLVSHQEYGAETLQRRLKREIPNIMWDTSELSRIFFPMLEHYDLPYLAEALNLSQPEDPILPDSQRKAFLTWKLFQACQEKGLGYDLSFFDQAQAFLDDWAGKTFFADLRREITLSFPERKIQTDLVLAPWAEGLFAAISEPVRVKIPDSREWVGKVFADGGILQQALPGYECRFGQSKMADLITEGLTTAHHVVVEAGTGTGKSFAYLIPSLWYACRTGRKVVVATHTIPLQEQLQKKDIPMLRKVLPFPFRSSVLKGKGNYCCLQQWLACLANPGEIRSREQRLAVLSILCWLRETKTGDIQEISKVAGVMELWPNLNSDHELCNPGKCPKVGVCFLFRARKQAEEADVLIVNHSLLFSDLKTNYNVLPEYHELVIDEAHQIYQTALQNLGSELSLETLSRLVEGVYRRLGPSFYGNAKQRLVPLMSLIPAVAWESFEKHLEEIPELSAKILEQARELFQLYAGIIGMERTLRLVSAHTASPWWDSLVIQVENLTGRLKALDQLLQTQLGILNADEAEQLEELKYTISIHRRELQEAADIFTLSLGVDNPKQVTWLERNFRLYLKTSPLEVSDTLKEKIFSRLDTVILTSATLSMANSFSHFLEDIGLPESTKTAIVDSPFNFEEQMNFYILKSEFQANNLQAGVLADLILEIAECLQGRTLVLFTAHKLLKETYTALEPGLKRLRINTLAQGVHGERTAILEAFKRNPRSVLLGANSFWEGIDIPGEALSCVIMVKLPFWPPSMPLIEARSEYLASQGRDPFRELLLPEAVIRFKQGFGRLIRSKEDRGFVVLLDDRVVNKYYGRYFLSSLPVKTHYRGDGRRLLQKIEAWKPENWAE